MPTLKAKDVHSALLRKGFEVENSHHVFFLLKIKGKRSSVKTKMSHGASELDDRLIGFMAEQLHLTKAQFNNLVSCPLSKEEYVDILVEKRVVILN